MTATGRRPHRKSRNGCLTCKRRRVKCDESGPPCNQCTLRGIDCAYGHPQPLQLPTPETPSTKRFTSPCSIAETDWSGSRRTLELELLHRWTSVTYISYCGGVVSEYFNWQVVVPQLALRHESLLFGMLAMSALEIAAFSPDDQDRFDYYVNVALEYHNTASSGLRKELSNITKANQQALFALSSILLILGLALPRFVSQRGEEGNMLDHMMTYLALLKGLKTIADTEPEFRKTEPLICNFRPWAALPKTELEPELHQVLQSLSSLNEEAHGAARIDRGTPELQAVSCHASCRRAIFYLEEAFAKCRNLETRSYSLVWPLHAGDDYTALLMDRGPVALLVMIVWGVLLEQTSYDLWWAQGIGSRLVEDLTKLLDIDKNDKVRAIVGWAWLQVGLDDS